MTSDRKPELTGDLRAIVITEIEAMGGAERCCLALSRYLHERGLKHHFVTYYDRIGLASYANHPIEVVQLMPKRQVMSKVAALGRHLRGMHSRYKPLESGYQPALHTTLAGVRGFHTLMHDTPSLFGDDPGAKSAARKIVDQLLHRIVGYGLRSGGKTIVASSYLQKETAEVFGAHAELLPIGGQAHSSSFHLRPVKGPLRMLSVSRLGPNKRLDWLVRALDQLEHGRDPLSRRIDWSFDIVGGGPEFGHLQQMIAEMKLGPRVTLHGFVSDEALEPIMSSANLMLIPARQGYGIPALEALYSGIPVLLHRESGVSDLLLDTPWAFVVSGDEASLAPALEKAMLQVNTGLHLNVPLPHLPTEDSWAGRVVDLCGWR